MDYSRLANLRLSSRVLWLAAAVILILTAAIVLRMGYLNELPSHTQDAYLIMAGQIDMQELYRLPLGYAAFLTPFLTWLQEPYAVKALNLVSYLVFLFAAWRWVAVGGGRRPGLPPVTEQAKAAWLVLLAGILLIHPYVLLSLSRTNESILAGALVMILVALVTGRPGLRQAVFAGIVLGVLVQVRANAVSLLLPLGVWLVWGVPGARLKERLPAAIPLGLAGLAGAAASFALLSMAATGHPNYRPTNGGYNVFAASNAYSYAEIVRNQNAEYALRPALAEHGIDFKQRNFVPEAQYMAWAREYALAHPADMAALTALKTATFFAPRLANANSALKKAVQFFTAGLFWVSLGWTALAFWRRRGWTDGMLLLVAASYSLPFVITNADPRMRFPLDLVFFMQLASLVAAAVYPHVLRLQQRFGAVRAAAT